MIHTQATAAAAGIAAKSTPRRIERTPLNPSSHSPSIICRRRTAAAISKIPVTIAQAAIR